MRAPGSGGRIGPSEIDPKDRRVPPPPGAQVGKAEDWWPRMVMLKILMQHYQARKTCWARSKLAKAAALEKRRASPAAIVAFVFQPGSELWE